MTQRDDVLFLKKHVQRDHAPYGMNHPMNRCIRLLEVLDKIHLPATFLVLVSGAFFRAPVVQQNQVVATGMLVSGLCGLGLVGLFHALKRHLLLDGIEKSLVAKLEVAALRHPIIRNHLISLAARRLEIKREPSKFLWRFVPRRVIPFHIFATTLLLGIGTGLALVSKVLFVFQLFLSIIVLLSALAILLFWMRYGETPLVRRIKRDLLRLQRERQGRFDHHFAHTAVETWIAEA